GGHPHREHRPGHRPGLAAPGIGPERHPRRSPLRDEHHRRPRCSAGSRRPWRPRPPAGSRPARRSHHRHRIHLWAEPRKHPAWRHARPLRPSNPEPAPMRPTRGFTLLEVVIAVAVTAMMGALIAAAFQSGYRTKDLVENEADRYRSLRTATDRMV